MAIRKVDWYVLLIVVLVVQQMVVILRSSTTNDGLQNNAAEEAHSSQVPRKEQTLTHPEATTSSQPSILTSSQLAVIKTAPKPQDKNSTKTLRSSQQNQGNAAIGERPPKPVHNNNQKLAICRKRHPILKYLQVAPPVIENNPTKILCFVLTKSEFHHTRVSGVKRSWGRKCDKLVIASDEDDPSFGSIAMKSEASYKNLWQKLNETAHYVYDNYSEQYEWFFKADDDTYLIMENLQAFLNQPNIQEKHNAGEPLIFGRRYSWVLAERLRSGKVPFQDFFNGTNATQENQDFGRRFYRKFTENPPVLYNHGGAGYVMNRSYLQSFLKALQSQDSLTGLVDEDLAHGAVMAYWDILPQSAVDAEGKQYFHPESPRYMHGAGLGSLRRLTGDNIPSESVRNRKDCCSRYSISFHHVTASQMTYLDNILFTCRQQEELAKE